MLKHKEILTFKHGSSNKISIWSAIAFSTTADGKNAKSLHSQFSDWRLMYSRLCFVVQKIWCFNIFFCYSSGVACLGIISWDETVQNAIDYDIWDWTHTCWHLSQVHPLYTSSMEVLIFIYYLHRLRTVYIRFVEKRNSCWVMSSFCLPKNYIAHWPDH